MSGNEVYALYADSFSLLKKWKVIILFRGVRAGRLFLKTAKCYVESAIVENQIIKSYRKICEALFCLLLLPH